MAAEIKFTHLQGFEEYPNPVVKVKRLDKDGKEDWFNVFGSGLHIEKHPDGTFFDRENGVLKDYVMEGRTDDMSNIMIDVFGTDCIRCTSLEGIKTRLHKILEYVDYKFPYQHFLEIIK